MMNLAGIQQRLDACRRRAARYLRSVQYESGGRIYWRHSAVHDPARHPEMLLVGTWAGTLAANLLGQLDDWSVERKRQVVAGLDDFRRDSGFYTLAEPAPGAARPDEYENLHVTNYAIGARRALLPEEPIEFPFLSHLLQPEQLTKWIDDRDWTNSWKEGNNIVNLASFYAVLAEQGLMAAADRMDDLADWHDRYQNKSTGFWHDGDGAEHEQLLNAMAGAAHNLHLYYYLGRDVPRHTTVIDSCLSLGYLGVCVACIDIDLADVLAHFRRYGYRTADIDTVLWRLLIELLQVQNPDGGFCNDYVRSDRQFGYETPATHSVTWATWFRLCTIGLMASVLVPEERKKWQFRRTLGMGFARLDWGPDTSGRESTGLSRVNPRWLAMRRQLKFARQRVTSAWRTRTSRSTNGRHGRPPEQPPQSAP
jgi:hypothetical protein